MKDPTNEKWLATSIFCWSKYSFNMIEAIGKGVNQDGLDEGTDFYHCQWQMKDALARIGNEGQKEKYSGRLPH